MITCRITVLKRTFNKELIDEYVEESRKQTIGPCEVFHEGQEFVTDVISGMPEGFCSWAWNDIYKSLVGFFTRGDFGMWYERKDVIIACALTVPGRQSSRLRSWSRGRGEPERSFPKIVNTPARPLQDPCRCRSRLEYRRHRRIALVGAQGHRFRDFGNVSGADAELPSNLAR